MNFQFQKAVKSDAKLRFLLEGPSGAGKTYTALRIATGLGGTIAVIDTERGSASKYADEFEFDVLELPSFSPETYMDAITAAEKAGYDIIIIDSLSHAWVGKDGALEMADKEAARSRSGNSFTAWKNVTPVWQRLLDRLISVNAHLIGTMRSKTEYVIEQVSGKNTPRKVGMAPVFRDGGEYEFDVVGEMDIEHRMVVTKTRCRLLDNAVIDKPGTDVADTLKAWLHGEPVRQPVERAESKTEGPKTKPARPFDAEAIKDALLRKAALDMKPSDEDRQKKAGIAFSNLKVGSDGRHKIMSHVFKLESLSEATAGQCTAFIDWIAAERNSDGEWIPNGYAIDEAKAIIAAYDATPRDAGIGDGLSTQGEPLPTEAPLFDNAGKAVEVGR